MQHREQPHVSYKIMLEKTIYESRWAAVLVETSRTDGVQWPNEVLFNL